MTIYYHETTDKITVYFSDVRNLNEIQFMEDDSELPDICVIAVRAGKRLVVDFRGVELLSSAVIARLFVLSTIAKQESVALRIGNVSPDILELFKVIRLDRAFCMDDDDPDLLGTGVPNPEPPGTLDGRAAPPTA